MAGRLIVVSGPSGVGKTSLLKEAAALSERLALSVSHTTRSPRKDEKEGEDYFFVDDKQFSAMAEDGAFLEHARVFGHYYGTSKRFVNALAARNLDAVLEIDWQGARQVRCAMKCFSVFILPPSLSALKIRLQGRKQDKPAEVERRLAEAVAEIRRCPEFEQWIVNDDYRRASQELSQVLARCTKDALIMQRARRILAALAAEDGRLSGLPC